MKYIVPILLLLLTPSCITKKGRIIHYEYNGAQVTRIDEGNVSSFYYGFCDNDDIECINESVTVDWSFENYLFGFLLFKNDSTIEIINGGGGDYTTHPNSDPRLFMKKYDNFQMSDIESYSEGNEYNNLFQLSNDVELESKRNNEFGSRVKAIYSH